MLLGRHLRFVPLRSKKVRAIKQLIDEGGTFSIAVQLKLSSDRLFIIPVNFENELIFEQNVSSSFIIGLHYSRHAGKIGKRFTAFQK